eukprot:gb/GECH01013724.1/.p1 GENE.gb/GECH01013724.1/~~gb/GECH01013724.1/.p1  ORF type:complete len:459 (+),score=85.67 gb/GECH01013724.1/:1-1377(+)
MQEEYDEAKKPVFDSDSEGEVIIEKTESSSSPKDKYHLIYFIYLLQGIGILLPWNAFISNPGYFKDAYSNFPKIIGYFGAVYTATNLLGTLGNTFIVGLITLKKRIIISQTICFLFLIVPPILAYTPLGQIPSFVLLLLSLAVIGFASAIFQGSMFGMADMLPSVYTQALMSGNGGAGVLVSFLTAILHAIFPSPSDSDSGSSSSSQGASDQERLGNLIYFLIGSLVLLFCILGYLVMLKNGFMNYYLSKHETHINEDEESPLVKNSVNSESDSSAPKKVSPFVVFRKIWRMELCVCSVFWVSLAIFPGLAETNIPSPNIPSDWFPILMINLFNIFDWIGRSLPRWFVLISENKLGYFIFGRIIFLPLFILCCQSQHWGPPVLQNEAFSCVFMVLMAISNGYLSSLAMMFGPSRADEHEKETAGSLMVFFLLLGLALGSYTCVGIQAALGNCSDGKCQ